MKHYPNSALTDPLEIERFVGEMKMANLITSHDGQFQKVESGVFNPVLIDGKYFLHLNRTDDQYKALKENPRAHLIYFDFLCNIPSYWVDELDGGVATSYYRHLDLDCEVKIYEEKESLAKILPLFLKVFQKEGGYKPITLNEEMYQSDFKVLGIVELTPISFKCKFKLGQNRDLTKRQEIMIKLTERGETGDLRAVREMQRWIDRESNK